MTNIEFFNLFTLDLFSRLYEAFPRKLDLEIYGIALELLDDNETPERNSELIFTSTDAIEFLASEGFLQTSGRDMSGQHFYNVQLTAKGLAALNATPDSLRPDETNFEKARDLASHGLKEAGKEAVKKVVDYILAAGIAVAAQS